MIYDVRHSFSHTPLIQSGRDQMTGAEKDPYLSVEQEARKRTKN